MSHRPARESVVLDALEGVLPYTTGEARTQLEFCISEMSWWATERAYLRAVERNGFASPRATRLRQELSDQKRRRRVGGPASPEQ